ncbi:MAG TPA: single-stranded-DNA-specific exonuclease RecJ [Candidatus Paceibacterota bacterium]|nr:single-stranded-DNA-specific exonuclease RecJ [Candidatus Paceibacterota bacterium]
MTSYTLRPRAYDDLLQDLLLARGVEGDEAQKQFLEPDFDRDSGDPMLLPDMEKAVERIRAAARNGEKVCVWSDYDCDGIPGGVMLTQFLRSIGLDVQHYIPHRHTEGYGLNENGIEELAGQGVTLIITIDLGTTEIEQIAFANKRGIDVIVTDHHIVQESAQNFPGFALINPKRPDSAYGFDGLCGAGVAWKLVQGILSKERYGIAEGQEKWFLDLVGISTLSDMVPLVGENRMIAHFGLRVLRRNRRPGLASLLTLLKIKASMLTEDDIGFMVSPRINAASRMDRPQKAAELLAAETQEDAQALAYDLNRINDERKGLVAATTKEVNRRLADMGTEGSVIVMGNPNWRPGILGLVANSLVEAHGKPVFLWGREGGDTIKGSCRAPDDVNLVELMTAARDAFIEFGGHSASGGFSVEEGRVHELSAKLEAAYIKIQASKSAVAPTVLEREVGLEEVSHASRALAQLAPFGVGNAKPLLIFPKVQIGRLRTFGKANDHLEISMSKGDTQIAGVSFFSTPESFDKKPAGGMTANIVGHIENDWRGKPRIRIVDII